MFPSLQITDAPDVLLKHQLQGVFPQVFLKTTLSQGSFSLLKKSLRTFLFKVFTSLNNFSQALLFCQLLPRLFLLTVRYIK